MLSTKYQVLSTEKSGDKSLVRADFSFLFLTTGTHLHIHFVSLNDEPLMSRFLLYVIARTSSLNSSSFNFETTSNVHQRQECSVQTWLNLPISSFLKVPGDKFRG